MDKKKLLQNAITDIDEKYINEAEEYKTPEKKHRSFSFGLTSWQKGFVAACVAIVVMVGVFTMPSIINSAIAAEPTPTANPAPTPYETRDMKDVNIFTDYAEKGVRYFQKTGDRYCFYGKEGYGYFEELGNSPHLPQAISPKEFNDISELRNGIYTDYDMSDFKFVCQDRTEYHVMTNYLAWQLYDLDNDDKTIDWFNKANKAFAENIEKTYGYAPKIPEAIEYDPAIFSEDLNDCYIGTAELVLDDGNLIYSYVDGKLSCIWFYACDTVFEIYSDVKQDWIHSVDGWLSDLASLETAPRAAERLRSISEASWDIERQYIYDCIEACANGDDSYSFPTDWYNRDKEKYPDKFYEEIWYGEKK